MHLREFIKEKDIQFRLALVSIAGDVSCGTPDKPRKRVVEHYFAIWALFCVRHYKSIDIVKL